jgi:hypothetical protein
MNAMAQVAQRMTADEYLGVAWRGGGRSLSRVR